MAKAPAKGGVINKGLIGKGAFGCVYLVENASKEQFAIKVMEWLTAGYSDREVADNELKVLKQLSHEHVLVYVDSFMEKGLMYIITEYCAGGDLSGFLDYAGKPVPEDLLRVWLWQMACGLEYMHTHDPSPVLHRDLKPSNIYLTGTGDIRLGDMGIARVLDAPDAMARTFCGTPPYMSPEALFEKAYNAKTDIWSLGCCVVEMATLERAYNGSTIYLLRNAVMQLREPMPSEFSRELDELVSKMMLREADDRVSATDILDQDILEACGIQRPWDLIVHHNLKNAMATGRRSSLSSTQTSATSTATETMTVHTLPGSLSNLTKIMEEEGEPMRTFRVKIERRIPGRRRGDDEDTLTSSTGSENLKTVLYKTQTMKTKGARKTPKVPTMRVPDDSLSRPVLASFANTLTTMRASRVQGPKPDTPVRVSADATRATQIETARDVLIQLVGKESLSTASSLVTSDSCRGDVLAGIAPMVGEDRLLSSMVIYLLLLDSFRPDSS